MADTDDNLEQLNALVDEIAAHTMRLARQGKLKNATPDGLMQELSETAMPLLRDFATRMFAELLSVRQYIHEEVEPAIMQLNDDAESLLLSEDAAMLTAELLSYRELLEGLKERAVGADRAAIEAKLAQVDTALARVAEITAEEEPAEPGAPDDDEPQADDDDDDPAEGGEDEGPDASAN